jgi:protein ImuB
MGRRFASIWFRHLTTDRQFRLQPELRDVPFVLAAPDHGRMVVRAASKAAEAKGVNVGMVVADCRAIFPALEVMDEAPGGAEKLLQALGEWCLRYTPSVAVDMPDGLMLDISGCPHLWGGERNYLQDLITKLRAFGYDVRAAIADTAAAAWAIARYGRTKAIIEPYAQTEALLPLPPAALRLETVVIERLEKLGLYEISSFINMPRRSLRRRFGTSLLTRLDQATGQEEEVMEPIRPIVPYQERLPSLEPIRTVHGIEIALRKLLEAICLRLAKEEQGLRSCMFKCYRIDGNMQQIGIGTSRASRTVEHLFRLFENKIVLLEPDLGFELFLLEAPVTEDLSAEQEMLWHSKAGHNDKEIAELLDKLADKAGMDTIHRYLPAEHHWPERSIKAAASLQEKPDTGWRAELPRPIHLLPQPELIEVSTRLPDYPPMLFKYKGQTFRVTKADGPERIELEWWLESGLPRDYYCVEDENGCRYWLFRLGHYYNEDKPKWFIHGFFA